MRPTNRSTTSSPASRGPAVPFVGGPGARVAGVHDVGDERRVVVVERDGPGLGAFRVLAAEFLGAGDAAALANLLKTHRVKRVVRIAPVGRTVAKFAAGAAELGAMGGGDDLAGALALIAESELPTDSAADGGGAHRRSAGVLLGGVLVAGWLAGSDHPGAPLSLTPESWTSVPAALAALLALAASAEGTAATNGHGAMGWADPAAGVVSIVARGERGTLARVVRVAPGEAEPIVAETCQATGVDRSHIKARASSRKDTGAAPASLLTVVSSPSALGSLHVDPAVFGLAAAAAALGSSGDPALAGLAGMSALAPRAPRAPMRQLVERLAQPRVGAAVAAACVAALLLVPLAVAAGRLAVLQARAGSESELRERLDEARRRSAYTKLLGLSRWPMSKLMADAARAAPVGVVVDSLELSTGDGLVVRGNAESAELVTAFSRNLADSGVFTGVITPSVDAARSGRGVEFQLRAKVGAPLLTATRLDDYAEESLAVRLYGVETAPGTGTTPTGARSPARRSISSAGASAGPSRGDGGRSFSRAPRGASNNEDAAPAAGGGGESGDGSGSVRPDRVRQSARQPAEAPAALTDAQIAAMDRTTAMREWAQRTAAAAKEQDAAVKARLNEEAAKCKTRMQEALKEGGGS